METEQRDYKQDYENDWKGIVEDELGNLNKDQVMRELSDYGILISSMAIILDHVTSGRISKPLTLPEIVCQVADECYNDLFSDERKEYEDAIKSLDDSCGDLRADNARLEAENAKMREALENLEENILHKIDDWANAYPEDVFIEPTTEEWKMLDRLFKDNGLNMTAYSGSIARRCVNGIQNYTKRGMEIIAALSPSTDESEESDDR